MATAAPRIDERIVRFVQGAPLEESAAALTRAAGSLAWELGLPRPSYEQVRVLARGRTPDARRMTLLDLIDVLYEYPGPGLAEWYRRYLSGSS